jgi:hypothetical protein
MHPMRRFVLLLHECPGDRPRPTHCDLLFECDGFLEAWSLDELPGDWRTLAGDVPSSMFAATNTVAAGRLADHRLAYLDYEGPVSGDRGTVRRLDAGTFHERDEPLSYTFKGEFIRGSMEFHHTAEPGEWQLIFTGS